MIYVSDKTLAARYEVSRATIWRWAREDKLPKPVKITNNCTRWEILSIEKWEAANISDDVLLVGPATGYKL